MKKRLLCMALILTAMLLAAACGTPADAIQWQEPALEALVREKLDKPKGAITPGDLEHIWGIELFGDTHIFFNADGGYNMYRGGSATVADFSTREDAILNPSKIAPDKYDDEEKYIPDGTYMVGGEQYARGSISSLADFANFRNLKFLHIHKNSLLDLSGLESLGSLLELRLRDDDITDAQGLAGLTQIAALELYGNPLQDISQLAALSQLRFLYLSRNQITDIDALASLPNLEHLSVHNNPITNLNALKGLENLTYIWIHGTRVSDLSPLAGKSSLMFVTMNDLDVESIDLAPLISVENLGILWMRQNKAELLNLPEVARLETLFDMEIVGSVNISEDDIEALKKALPNCNVH